MNGYACFYLEKGDKNLCVNNFMKISYEYKIFVSLAYI